MSIGGMDGGVPMSHVDYKKWLCGPGDFKKVLCRLSLRPKKGCVIVSILGVYHLLQGCTIISF